MSYSTIVRLCLALVGAVTVAFGYAFLYGIPFHFLVGNAPAVIVHDVRNTLSMGVALVCLSLAVLCFASSVMIIINRHARGRNYRANQLLRKFRKGTLSEEEKKQFEAMRESGVLTYNSYGQLRLSDQAVEDVYPL